MAIRKPIVTNSGKLQQLPDGDVLDVGATTQTLAYTGSQLDTITTTNGTKTFTYTSRQS